MHTVYLNWNVLLPRHLRTNISQITAEIYLNAIIVMIIIRDKMVIMVEMIIMVEMVIMVEIITVSYTHLTLPTKRIV